MASDQWFDDLKNDYHRDVQRPQYYSGRRSARPAGSSGATSSSSGGSADASDLAGECVADQPAPPAFVQFPSIPTPIKGQDR